MTKRQSWLALAAALCSITFCFVLLCGPMVRVSRGFQLNSFRSGEYTYDVWSNGSNWRYYRKGLLSYSENIPPYTLVLAIRRNDGRAETVHCQSLVVIYEGHQVEVAEKLLNPSEPMQKRSQARISQPYAAFVIRDALDESAGFELAITFLVDEDSAEEVHQRLPIDAFESREFLFRVWESMMGV